MIFKDPIWLVLVLLIVAGVWGWRSRQKQAGLRFPSLGLIADLGKTWKQRFSGLPFFLRLAVLVLLGIALAGPRSVLEEVQHKTEGIDIVLAIDASGSMAAEDFTLNGKRVNRLAVIKDVVGEFIKGRPNDRLGLVAFGGVAYTVSPLTTDHQWLARNLQRVELGLIEDSTAIGSAISSSLARLRQSQAKSKVVILLTDGMNNAGNIEPLQAAEAARALGIKIYTIGAGTKGYAPFPVKDVWGQTAYQKVKIDIDEEMLARIAELTGAKYFRATDTTSLQSIYKEIDRLEKTEIEQLHYQEYKELFVYFLAAGLTFLLIELLLSQTWLLRVP